MPEKILTVGAADMDLQLNMHAIPAPGTTAVEENRAVYTAGGGGGAAALALARMGAAPVLGARLGGDLHGQRLLRLYREYGVITDHLAIDRRLPTGFRTVIREDSGDTRAVYYPGANANILLSDIEQAITDGAPEAICLRTDLPADLVVGVSRLAVSYGIPLFMDGDGIDPSFPLASLGRSEIFCPDDKQTYTLTGTYPVGTDSCLKAAVELEKHVKARYFVIRIGERGLFVYDGRYCHMVPTYDGHARESTPLAETLLPVLSLEYLRNGRDILAACRFALGYNALLVKNAADPAYFPEVAEIRDFVEKH